MIEQIFLIAITFLVSVATFYSTFGLSTLLVPVLTLFFPVSLAIALVAVIHLLNNLFKSLLLWRYIDWYTTVRFGLTAMLFAFLGAKVLVSVANVAEIYSYTIGSYTAHVTVIKLIVGILLLFFTLLQTLPLMKKLLLSHESLFVGEALSGFFGGLSGHQGAFRTAYLLHTSLSKTALIATAATISLFVDVTRLIIYGLHMQLFQSQVPILLMIAIIISSLAGAIIAMHFLKKTTNIFIQKFITMILYLFSILLIIGIL